MATTFIRRTIAHISTSARHGIPSIRPFSLVYFRSPSHIHVTGILQTDIVTRTGLSTLFVNRVLTLFRLCESYFLNGTTDTEHCALNKTVPERCVSVISWRTVNIFVARIAEFVSTETRRSRYIYIFSHFDQIARLEYIYKVNNYAFITDRCSGC